MKNNEESNYKEYAKESTPDLWDRIDSNLPEEMFTKDSSSKITKFKRRKIYTISTILAASLILVTLTAVQKSSNRLQQYSSENSSYDAIANNKNVTDSINSIGEPESSNSNSVNSNKNSEEDNNSPYTLNDNAITSNETLDSKEEQIPDMTITLTVTKHHTTDIGLVYEGIVTSTTSKNIAIKDTVYVTLRQLTRHELRHTYEPKESFTITVTDDRFTSSANKPYYATSLIK